MRPFREELAAYKGSSFNCGLKQSRLRRTMQIRGRYDTTKERSRPVVDYCSNWHCRVSLLGGLLVGDCYMLNAYLGTSKKEGDEVTKAPSVA